MINRERERERERERGEREREREWKLSRYIFGRRFSLAGKVEDAKKENMPKQKKRVIQRINRKRKERLYWKQ